MSPAGASTSGRGRADMDAAAPGAGAGCMADILEAAPPARKAGVFSSVYSGARRFSLDPRGEAGVEINCERAGRPLRIEGPRRAQDGRGRGDPRILQSALASAPCGA